VIRLLILLISVCGLLAFSAGQGPTLDNYRPRLPAGQAGAVACITPDLNGDGLADLVRASRWDFGIWLQDAAGRFNPVDFPKQIPATIPPQEIVCLATGMLTAAGSVDVVVGYRSGLVHIYPKLGTTFGKPNALPTILGVLNPALEQILVGDCDRNSNALDELVLLLDQDRPVVFIPSGVNYWRQLRLIGARIKTPRGLLVDLDLDSDLDLLIVTGRPSATHPGLYLNNGKIFVINVTAFRGSKICASHIVAADVLGGRSPEIFFAPTGTSLTDVRVFRNGSTVPGQPSFLPVVTTNNAYNVVQPRDFDVTDLDGDGHEDLVSVTATGSVTYGLSMGASSPTAYSRPQTLLPASHRSRICAVDLEADGDTDLLVAGDGIEDSLLLGGPSSMPLMTVDTEAQGMPIRMATRNLVEAMDVTGEGDLDLVVLSASGGGTPVLLHNQDGQARFEEIPYTGQVPSLPKANYKSIHPALVRGKGDLGYLILGSITNSNTRGVRVWVPGAKAAFDDESLTRWQVKRLFDSIVAADVSGIVAGSLGNAGCSDVVGIDDLGFLRIVINRAGIYSRELLVSSTAAALGSKLLVQDLNLDGLADILVVQPRGSTRVLLASSSSPDTYVESTPIRYAGSTALCQDLTGDLIPDVLISVSNAAKRLVFLQGLGNGKFSNRTGVFLANIRALPASAIALQFLAGEQPGSYSVVLGFASEPDQILAVDRWVVNSAELLPLRGSRNTSGYLVCDYDTDGDLDLVVTRQDTFPSVLLGQATDFCNIGMGQAGREALIHVAYPDMATVGGIGIGFPSMRADLGSLGIMRLARISVLIPVASSTSLKQAIRLPLPARMASTQVPMQLITVRNGELKFRNLDNFRPTMR
jgi:hypothetical protein